MAATHVDLDQPADVHEEQGRIIIEPVRRKSFKLDELISGITGRTG